MNGLIEETKKKSIETGSDLKELATLQLSDVIEINVAPHCQDNGS